MPHAAQTQRRKSSPAQGADNLKGQDSERETEAQKGKVTCPWSHRESVEELGSESGGPYSKGGKGVILKEKW